MGFPIHFDIWRIFHTKKTHAHIAMTRRALCVGSTSCWIILLNVKSPQFVEKHFQVKVVSIQTVNDSHIVHDFHIGFHFCFCFFSFLLFRSFDSITSIVQTIENQMLRIEKHLLGNFECLIVSKSNTYTSVWKGIFPIFCCFVSGIWWRCSFFVGCASSIEFNWKIMSLLIDDELFYSQNCFVLFSYRYIFDSLIFRFFIDSIRKICSNWQ